MNYFFCCTLNNNFFAKDNYSRGNKNLSIVVRTQNILCNIMPKTNNAINVYKNGVLNMSDNIYAPTIVIITSATAILNILYECIPFPGIPNASLYLHNDILSKL